MMKELNYSPKKIFVFNSIAIAILILGGCLHTDSKTTAPDEIPEGMAFIPGGLTTIGSVEGKPNEQPVFEEEVEPFFMDLDLVTVAEFRQFVEETNYETEAEKFGNAVVFDFEMAEWILIDGATWQYPNGSDGQQAEDDHPVRQVSWTDAKNYLEWAGKRLPTEIEWEHAAKGGENLTQKYAWGDSLTENDDYKANTWNGVFPVENVADDGYLQTSPVGKFNITELGLTDMGGNVWEWTENWYRSYNDRNKPFEPNQASEKVLRGGSFMCHVSYCHGYRVTARSHTPPENSLFHVGFRGVMDIDI